MPNLKKIKAIANLGNHFWIHVFRRLVRKPRPGEELARFKAFYEEDKIVGLTAGERERLREYQRCIACGTCSRVCPVYGPATHGFYRAPDSIAGSLSRSFPEYGSARDAVYNCTQCGACAAACPRGIDVPDLVMSVRRKMMEADGTLEKKLFDEWACSLSTHGNAHQSKFESCHPGKTADFGEWKKAGPVDYVYFTGCFGRTFGQDTTRASLELLRRLGVNFTVVDDACCGGFHRSAGLLTPTHEIVENAVRKILATGAKKVVTDCPHGLFTMLTHPVYKSSIKPLHTSQLLNELNISFNNNGRERELVTYHDPCFLGRRLGIYDAPRTLIERTGATLIEMPNNRERAICCGARDGEFTLDERVAEEMARSRYMEAVRATDAKGILVTACPQCASAFTAAAGEEPHAGAGILTLSKFLLEYFSQK